jgi:Flp pilus assembly protein CpaB
MSRFIILSVALAVLAAGGTIAFKLTHRPALAAPAQPIDPAILHGVLQRGRDAMALP